MMIGTKIEMGICNLYNVFAWKNGWIMVSEHRYIDEAKQIEEAIKDSYSREYVKKLIEQQDSRNNKLKLKYYENWNKY